MLKIRLRRMGSRHRPFYRFVVSDSRRVPTATAIDEVGHYNPILKPAEIRVDFAKIEHWLARGAQTSVTVEKLLAKARKGTPVTEVPIAVPLGISAPVAPEPATEPIATEPIATEPIATEPMIETAAEPAADETASEAASA